MAPNGKSGAPSFSGWLVVVDAGGDLIGRIRGSEGRGGEEEDRIRQEMTDGMTPSVTLSPVYRLTSQIVDVGGAPRRVRESLTLEDSLDFGARLPFHVLLTKFAFLSELDEKSRIILQRKIDEVEKLASAAKSNIVLAR